MNGRASFRDLASRLEFGDLPLLIYFTAFVRQYLFVVGNNTAAWVITLPLAVIVWWSYVATRPPRQRPHWAFWLIVFIPLAFIFSTRVAYPDTSFDVLTYHILYSERALNGVLH